MILLALFLDHLRLIVGKVKELGVLLGNRVLSLGSRLHLNFEELLKINGLFDFHLHLCPLILPRKDTCLDYHSWLSLRLLFQRRNLFCPMLHLLRGRINGLKTGITVLLLIIDKVIVIAMAS